MPACGIGEPPFAVIPQVTQSETPVIILWLTAREPTPIRG